MKRPRNFRLTPGHSFLAVAVLFLLAALYPTARVVDLHLNDTMFVVSPAIVCIALALFSGIGFLIYQLTGFLMYRQWLSWVHFVLTTLFFIILYVDILSPPTPFNGNSEITIENWQHYQSRVQLITSIEAGIFLLGQLALLINLIVGGTKAILKPKRFQTP